MLEKYFECEHLSPDETEELLKMYANYINTNKPNKFKEVIYHAYKYLVPLKRKNC